MKYLLLEGFPKGLDARKFSLSAPAGTLVELNNGHLTNGGEIEKRKAFVEYADVSMTETGATATAGIRTFGVQKTSSGLTVFGSAIEYFTAATVSRATAANVATLNIGAHTLRAGDLVTITGITGYTAANVALISATSPNITYSNVHANEGTTADVTGTVVLTQPTLSRPVLASAMPTGITYQQLQHPAVADGETYVAASHAMTAVKSSTSYGGRIYALATFADENTFGYYDGTLDRSFTDGLIMAHLNTNTKIATAIKEMVNRSRDYLATNPSGTVAQVTGPVGLPYSTVATDNSAGTLAAAKVSDPTAATEARQAIGSFAVIAGSGGASGAAVATTHRARATNVATLTIGTHTLVVGTKVTIAGLGGSGYNASNQVLTAVGATTISYANAGGNEGTTADTGGTVTVPGQIVKVEVNNVTITNGAELWITSNEVTATALALSINSKSSAPEYTAEANGNTLTIKAAESDGDSPNDYVVKVTAAGDLCCGRVQFQVNAAAGFTNAVGWVDGVNVTGTVSYTTSPAATATAIVAAINAGTFVGAAHGYLANAQGAIITISKAITRSDDANVPAYFVVTGGGAGNGIFELDSGAGPVSGLTALLTVTGVTYGPYVGNARFVYYQLFLTITGGVAPYQAPVWYGGGVTNVGGGQYSTAVRQWFGDPVPSVPHLYCAVTDSSLAIANSNTL